MSITYKITYEHRDGKETRAETVLLRSDHEPTQDEVQTQSEGFRQISLWQRGTEIAGFSIISVVSEP